MTTERSVTIDISDWDVEDWNEYLFSTVDIEKEDAFPRITISLNEEKFSEASKLIGQEALQIFFEGQFISFTLRNEGLIIDAGEDVLESRIAIPLKNVWLEFDKAHRDELVAQLLRLEYYPDGSMVPQLIGEGWK